MFFHCCFKCKRLICHALKFTFGVVFKWIDLDAVHLVEQINELDIDWKKEDICLDRANFTLHFTKKADCQLQRRNLLPCFSQIVARSICSPVKIQGEKFKETYDLIAKGKCFEMRLYTAETKNTKKENIQESGDLNIKWEYFKIGFRWEKIGNLCKLIFRLGTCRGRTRSRRAEQSRMRRCPLTKPVLLSSS